MLKKLAIAFAASAFAVTLAAPIASACPGMEKPKQQTADKDAKAKKVAKKQAKKATKKADKAKKTPAKVAQKQAKK